MAKIPMIATRPQTFAGRYVDTGERIMADDAKQASLLRALHRAKDDPEFDEKNITYRTAALAPVATSTPAKRSYKRRDVKAGR